MFCQYVAFNHEKCLYIVFIEVALLLLYYTVLSIVLEAL